MSEGDWPDAIRKLYRQRWRIWIVACLAHAVGLFHRAAMAPMADRLMADFDLSAMAFGSLGAVYFYVYAAMQLPSGTFADTVGPRKTITIGLLLSAAGSLVMSMAPSFSIIYLGRLMVSFGVSVVWLSTIKLVMGWFRTQELATMFGFSASLVSLGQIAATTPLALLIISVGWRMSLVTIAQVTFGIAVASWFIIRNSPAQVGLRLIEELNGRNSLRVGKARDSSGLSLAQRFNIVLSNKNVWALFLQGFGTYGAYSTMFHNWGVVYVMQTYSVPRDFAANFVLIATIGLIAGAPVAGFLSDRIFRKRRLPLILFTGISLASFLLLTLWNGGRPPLEALYPLCFFVGFGTGAIAIKFASIKDMVQPSVQGIASGLVNIGGFASAAVAQPVFGYILDQGWVGDMMEGARVYPLQAFQQGLWLCCALTVLGLLGALLVKETHRHGSL